MKKRENIVGYFGLPGLKNNYKFPLHTVFSKVDAIEQLSANAYGVSLPEMKTRRRYRRIVEPRQVAMFLLHRYSLLNKCDIAKRFKLDHTTVIHSIRVVENLMQTDQTLRTLVNNIEMEIQ